MRTLYRRIGVLILILTVNIFAGDAGNTGLSFLKIGVGAPAAGMGNAYTAVATDGLAGYWNPAGLMGAPRSNVVFTHTVWLFDAVSEFAALQFRGKRSSLALHLYSFYIGEIPVRLIPSAQPLGTTSAQYLSTGISYARRWNDRLAVGATVKYLYEKIYIETATGWAVDLGLRYRVPGKPLVLAATLQHLGTMNALVSQASTLPTLVRVGMLLAPQRRIGPLRVRFALDGVRYLSAGWRLNSGLEFLLGRQLILRTGYLAGYAEQSLAFGFGFRKATLRLDYSFTPFAAGLGDVHRFSLYLAL